MGNEEISGNVKWYTQKWEHVEECALFIIKER